MYLILPIVKALCLIQPIVIFDSKNMESIAIKLSVTLGGVIKIYN